MLVVPDATRYEDERCGLVTGRDDERRSLCHTPISSDHHQRTAFELRCGEVKSGVSMAKLALTSQPMMYIYSGFSAALWSIGPVALGSISLQRASPVATVRGRSHWWRQRIIGDMSIEQQIPIDIFH